MKIKIIFYLFVIIVLGSNNLLGQDTNVNSNYFESLRVPGFQYLEDSSLVIEQGGPLEADYFLIKFYSINFNPKDNILKLEGQTTYNCKGENRGFSYVEIFKAVRVGDTLTKKEFLCFSFDDENNREKNGLFKLKIKVSKGERLYFRYPYYFLVEYTISNLLNHAILRTNNAFHITPSLPLFTICNRK
jgi:hypothetical protein